MIWKQKPTLDMLNSLNSSCLVGHIGIEFTEIGEDYLIATMPVDKRTQQPMGLLHGGASVVLAETLGSVASLLMLNDLDRQAIVGVEINANHLKAVRDGIVIGKVTAVKLGRKLHIWDIEITNPNGDKVCISRLTTMVIDKK